jgi:hypothetical protein
LTINTTIMISINACTSGRPALTPLQKNEAKPLTDLHHVQN